MNSFYKDFYICFSADDGDFEESNGNDVTSATTELVDKSRSNYTFWFFFFLRWFSCFLWWRNSVYSNFLAISLKRNAALSPFLFFIFYDEWQVIGLKTLTEALKNIFFQIPKALLFLYHCCLIKTAYGDKKKSSLEFQWWNGANTYN